MKTHTSVCTIQCVWCLIATTVVGLVEFPACPSMLALLTGYIILQYNSKRLWKAKIISIAAEGTKVAVTRSFLF